MVEPQAATPKLVTREDDETEQEAMVRMLQRVMYISNRIGFELHVIALRCMKIAFYSSEELAATTDEMAGKLGWAALGTSDMIESWLGLLGCFAADMDKYFPSSALKDGEQDNG